MSRCDFCLYWQPIFNAVGSQVCFRCTASKEVREEKCFGAMSLLGLCLSKGEVQLEVKGQN